MSYSFEYIDIILLAMIAGFIFLRLRGILGRKSGFEDEIQSSYEEKFSQETVKNTLKQSNFDEAAKKNFLIGAKIAYENIITSFSSGNLVTVKQLLDKQVYKQFEEAISEREKQGIKSETTFIGINSAEIKQHKRNGNFLDVTVEFVSEIISCVKDKDSKIISGDPEKVKKVYDTWKFSKNVKSNDPNWSLVETNL